jgi:hypothetical protein
MTRIQSLPDALLPFVPWLLAGLAMVSVSLFLRRRKGTPKRLAERYPAVEPAHGTRLRRELAMFGYGYFSMARVRLGADAERLHVRVTSSSQGIGSFSVPLGEITTALDRYPWMILAPDTIRLRFAREPEAIVMVPRKAFRQLAESSGGRLRVEGIAEPGAHTAASVFSRR